MAFCTKLSGLVTATLSGNSVSSVNATTNMQMFIAMRRMATKLYVGGTCHSYCLCLICNNPSLQTSLNFSNSSIRLSYETDEGSLRSAFEGFGEVTEAFVINDRDTGRSRGFGFVNYASDDSANKAISAMDGKELDGRPIRVNIANDRPPRVGGGGGY